MSCGIRNSKGNMRNANAGQSDYGIYTDYVQLDRYEVVDSLTLDSMINVAIREHEKITGCKASFFIVNQINGKYIIQSTLAFNSMFSGMALSDIFGFSYYKEHILLVGKTIQVLFKATGKNSYVLLFSGIWGGWSDCWFDSDFHFTSSEGAMYYK